MTGLLDGWSESVVVEGVRAVKVGTFKFVGLNLEGSPYTSEIIIGSRFVRSFSILNLLVVIHNTGVVFIPKILEIDFGF